MKRLMLMPLMFLWAQAALAASPIIVDGSYVDEAITRNAVVWDVRPADAYARGHIAGAINIGDAAKVLRDENTEDFIATDRIESILGAAGLDPKRETIVYGSRGTWNPYLALYTLQYFGGSNVRVYHDGIEDWVASGRAISREASQLPPVALKLEINPTVAVTTKEMVARLNNPNVQIVHARTLQEFRGEDIRAIRGDPILFVGDVGLSVDVQNARQAEYLPPTVRHSCCVPATCWSPWTTSARATNGSRKSACVDYTLMLRSMHALHGPFRRI